MKAFFVNLFSSDDLAVDSIVFGGLLALFGLLGFTGYALVANPASFSPVTYATAAGGLIAGIGGGRRLRDAGKPAQ